MTAVINRDLFIYNLTVYLLNKAEEFKNADKKTQKKWISEVRKAYKSNYLDPSFTRLYPDKPDANGVFLTNVWDDIRNLSTLNAIQILSDIDEIFCPANEDFEAKTLVYLMNAFIRQTPVKIKVFSN